LHADRAPQLKASVGPLASKETMKRWVAYLAVGLLALLIGAGSCSAFLNNSRHVWTTVNEEITYGGQPSPTSQLYVSKGGDLLVDLRDRGDTIYIVNPNTQEIGVPNESNFFMVLGYACSKELEPPAVSMTQSMGKIQTNPELVVEPYLIEFTSLKNARVRVTWYLNF
jgi:hypothetical protein